VTLGCSTPSFVHIIQNDIDQDIRRVINAGTLEREGSELICKSVPAKELSKVDVADLECLHVFERV